VNDADVVVDAQLVFGEILETCPHFYGRFWFVAVRVIL